MSTKHKIGNFYTNNIKQVTIWNVVVKSFFSSILMQIVQQIVLFVNKNLFAYNKN